MAGVDGLGARLSRQGSAGQAQTGLELFFDENLGLVLPNEHLVCDLAFIFDEPDMLMINKRARSSFFDMNNEEIAGY